MKKAWIKLGACALALIMAMVFAGCDTGGGGGGRRPVRDGTVHTQGGGFNATERIHVTTTFGANSILRISITSHGENLPIMETVQSRLIPRIIQSQSIGVDVIAGGTVTSVGVLDAIAEAIYEAGGHPDEWLRRPRDTGRTVILPSDGGAPFDVIVVGLGGAGLAAYWRATEGDTPTARSSETTVFGIERAAKIGGNSAMSGGFQAINSTHRAARYFGGNTSYSGGTTEQWRDAFRTIGGGPTGLRAGGRYGNARSELTDILVQRSGQVLDWFVAPPYSFNFAPPGTGSRGNTSGIAAVQFGMTGETTATWGNDQWGFTGALGHVGFFSDDPDDVHKTIMWQRALDTARARNPRNDYMLELTARRILLDEDTGDIIGVEAVYHDGTTFIIHGRTVILATGGFLGDFTMMERYYPGIWPGSTGITHVTGDGIRMAQAHGGATYNFGGPVFVGGSARLRTIPRTIINHPYVQTAFDQGQWLQTLMNLKNRPFNLIVAQRPGLTLGGPVDNVGQRWTVTGTGGNLAGAGGRWAAIFSDDVFPLIAAEGIGFRGGEQAFQLPLGTGLDPNVPVPFLMPLLQWASETGNVVRANTIPELAGRLGVNVDVLTTQINTWNTIVTTGNDTQFTRNAAQQGQLNDPRTRQVNPAGPFTAVLGGLAPYSTASGLDVDTWMRVLSMEGGLHGTYYVSRGLFAAGADTLGVMSQFGSHNQIRTSTAQGWSWVSGKVAGERAVQTAQAIATEEQR